MKAGFTLIEVLIATVIASLLMATLFFSYDRINNSVRKVGDIADIFETATLIDQVLFNDVSGAFIPVEAIPPKKEVKKKPGDEKGAEKDKKDDKEKGDKDKGDEKMVRPADATAMAGQAKSKVPLLKDPFLSTNKADNMNLLTFITANPMRVYVSEKTGEPKASCARVVYTLQEKKDKSKKRPLYELYRQEGAELELAPYTKQDSKFERYLIADNVVSCKLTFVVTYEKKEEENDEKKGEQSKKQPEQGAKKKEQKPKIETKEFQDWQVGKDEKDIRTKTKLPTEVFMELKISNAIDTRERSFGLRVPVAATFQEVPVQEPPRPAPSAQPQGAQKPGAAGVPAAQDKKQALADGANKLVQNLRTQFGRA